jgi:hypothetical protein
MATQSLREIEKRLRVLFEELSTFKDMRPGTLSVQYRKPQERKNPFHQLSYTHKGKSRSEYVRTENLQAIEREIKAYKRFRELSEEIVTLSIEASRMRCMRPKP